MPDRNKPLQEESAKDSDELSIEELEEASGGKVKDTSDELSIEELEEASGGVDYPPPPPDPNAGC